MGKISAMTALTGTGAATGDKLPIVDVSAGTSGSKAITMAELLTGLMVVNTTALTGTGAAVGDTLLIYDLSATASKSITTAEFLNLLGTVNAAGTALTGANTATGDQFAIWDVSATAMKYITRAETEIALRDAATASRMVDLNATSLTITAATHDSRIVTLSHTAATSTVTLPDATGSGARYTFIVKAVNTNSHIIKVPDASNVMKGSVNILDNDAAAQTAYAASGTDDTLTLNGTTTGGQIGDWVEFVDLGTDTWAVRGSLVVPAGSNPADCFSATV